ncbi:MAG: hypothetical protein O9283_01940 [Sphingomonadaceae bacterium]|jgi:hypothetical protein|nr:hypothetical protein [Sphingomonadaceae bacterium]
MPKPPLPLRLLAIIAACLTLAGCIFPPQITSRAVTIPVAERGADPRLEGVWWQLEVAPDRTDFRIFRIRQSPDRTYQLSYADRISPDDETSTDDIEGKVVLLDTPQPGVDLLIFTSQDGSMYALALHSRAGSLVLAPFLGATETAIGPDRTGYLASIAARHGISLRAQQDTSDLLLDGKLDRQSLVALFGDPEFLGGLRLDQEHVMTLLPANRPLPPRDDPLAWWPPAYPWQIVSPRFAVAASELVRPPELTGKFREGSAHATISAQPDGSLLVSFAADPDGGNLREPRRLRLVEIGTPGRLLALVEQREAGETGQPERLLFGYFLVTRRDDGTWSFTALQTSVSDLSRSLNQARQDLRRRSAARHGLTLDGSTLTGALDLARVKALLADRQFQAGLATGEIPAWFELTPVAPGQR